jgi:hypothetical protein
MATNDLVASWDLDLDEMSQVRQPGPDELRWISTSMGSQLLGPGFVGFPARDGQLGSFLVPGLSGSQLEETRGRHPRRDHTSPLAMTNPGQLLGWNQARWISFMKTSQRNLMKTSQRNLMKTSQRNLMEAFLRIRTVSLLPRLAGFPAPGSRACRVPSSGWSAGIVPGLVTLR